MTLRTTITTIIPHTQQRYPTAGDWQVKTTTLGPYLHLHVSAMPDPRMEQALIIHELVEAFLCYNAGISTEVVDAFDTGPGAYLTDPGNDPVAPYHDQHLVATDIERRFVAAAGLSWEDYEAALDNLIWAEPSDAQ